VLCDFPMGILGGILGAFGVKSRRQQSCRFVTLL
jgi:hypothetical protein